MRIAIVAAGFTADGGRPAAPRHGDLPRNGTIHQFEDDFIEGMVEHGYERDFAERCFKQIEGLRRIRLSREPRRELRAAGLCLGLAQMPLPGGLRLRAAQQPADGLLRAGADRARRARPRRRGAAGRRQPQRLGLHARERPPTRPAVCAVRLGFRQIKGFAEADAVKRWSRRAAPATPTPRDAVAPRRSRRAGARSAGARRRLPLAGPRPPHGAMGRQAASAAAPLPLLAAAEAGARPSPRSACRPCSLGEQVVEDYATLRLSLEGASGWPAARAPRAQRHGAGAAVCRLRDGDAVTVAGLVLVRQRPGTAKGVIFITLEDETGIANLVVWPAMFERFRRVVMRPSCSASRAWSSARASWFTSSPTAWSICPPGSMTCTGARRHSRARSPAPTRSNIPRATSISRFIRRAISTDADGSAGRRRMRSY